MRLAGTTRLRRLGFRRRHRDQPIGFHPQSPIEFMRGDTDAATQRDRAHESVWIGFRHGEAIKIRHPAGSARAVERKQRVAHALEGLELENHRERLADRPKCDAVVAITEHRALGQKIAFDAQPEMRAGEWHSLGFARELIELFQREILVVASHREPRIGEIQQGEAGQVAGLQPARIKLDGWR